MSDEISEQDAEILRGAVADALAGASSALEGEWLSTNDYWSALANAALAAVRGTR